MHMRCTREGHARAMHMQATMIASLLLVDYIFFEQDNGMCSCDGSSVKPLCMHPRCGCTSCACILDVHPTSKSTSTSCACILDVHPIVHAVHMRASYDAQVKITLCETYCCGSLCPWNITFSKGGNSGGGGAAPTSNDMPR